MKFILTTVLFILILVMREAGFFNTIDALVYERTSSMQQNPIIYYFSETASIGAFVIAIALIAIYQYSKSKKFSRSFLDFVAAFIISSLLVVLIKDLTKVIRPGVSISPSSWLIALTDYYSFPSGHTTRAMVASYYLSKKWEKWKFVFVIYSLLIGISRVLLGVHWFSDVVFAYVVGLETCLIVDKLYTPLYKVYSFVLKEKRIG